MGFCGVGAFVGRIAGEGFGLSWGDFELLWIRVFVDSGFGGEEGSGFRGDGFRLAPRDSWEENRVYVGVFRGEDLGFGGEEGGFRGRNL